MYTQYAPARRMTYGSPSSDLWITISMFKFWTNVRQTKGTFRVSGRRTFNLNINFEVQTVSLAR